MLLTGLCCCSCGLCCLDFICCFPGAFDDSQYAPLRSPNTSDIPSNSPNIEENEMKTFVFHSIGITCILILIDIVIAICIMMTYYIACQANLSTDITNQVDSLGIFDKIALGVALIRGDESGKDLLLGTQMPLWKEQFISFGIVLSLGAKLVHLLICWYSSLSLLKSRVKWWAVLAREAILFIILMIPSIPPPRQEYGLCNLGGFPDILSRLGALQSFSDKITFGLVLALLRLVVTYFTGYFTNAQSIPEVKIFRLKLGPP